jgi:hypothetical protein
MRNVTIGSGPSVVTLGPRDATGFWVDIAADGLTIRTGVYMADEVFFRSLVGYFEDLAANWRGWAGEKRWRSIESDLEFVASHEARGHCVLEVIVRDGPRFTWKATLTGVSLDVGEELSQLVREMRMWADYRPG